MVELFYHWGIDIYTQGGVGVPESLPMNCGEGGDISIVIFQHGYLILNFLALLASYDKELIKCLTG